MPRKTRENDVPGLGVEGQWAMEALRGVVELGKTGQLQDNPFYSGCPLLTTAEAELFGSLMNQEKVHIRILPFNAPPFIKHRVNMKKGKISVMIEMKPDVAAVIRGIAGFDDIVYRSQNESLVQLVKTVSREVLTK